MISIDSLSASLYCKKERKFLSSFKYISLLINMALAIRGFILGAPKPNTLQLPSCKSYQQKAMTMLQTQHHGLKLSRRISHSLITCAGKPNTGSGPKINQTPSSEQKVSDLSSSNSEKTGKKSKGSGEANATTKKTG